MFLIENPSRYPDSFFVSSFSRFIPRIVCACNRAKNRGIAIIDDTEYSNLHHSNLVWKLKTENCAHPLDLLIEGEMHKNSAYVIEYVSNKFMLPKYAFSAGFAEGFKYDKFWKNVYLGLDEYHWTCAAMFEVGRFIRNKITPEKSLLFLGHEKINHLLK